MMVVNFDGCAVGLVDKAETPFLKKWRLATTNERLARTFADKRCRHDHSFEHAQIAGSNTPTTAIYPIYMCELVFSALFPEIVYRDVPAMPVMQSCEHVFQHVPNEPLEGAELEAAVYESVDSFACPADPEEHELEPLESRDERLKREATSLEHMTLHEKKNPFCEHCIRGRMLKRYAKSHRDEPEEAERVYERPTGFGHLIEADNMFPSEESQGNDGEKTALVVLDRFSGVSFVYPGRDRSEETVFEALKHFGGHRLNGDPNVVFKSDSATELTKAAARLCWNIAPSVPRSWPHNAHTEREIRAIKNCVARPIYRLVSTRSSGRCPLCLLQRHALFGLHAWLGIMRKAPMLRRSNRARRVGMLQQAVSFLVPSTPSVPLYFTGQRATAWQSRPRNLACLLAGVLMQDFATET